MTVSSASKPLALATQQPVEIRNNDSTLQGTSSQLAKMQGGQGRKNGTTSETNDANLARAQGI